MTEQDKTRQNLIQFDFIVRSLGFVHGLNQFLYELCHEKLSLQCLIIVIAASSLASQGPHLVLCRLQRLRSDWADANADLSMPTLI